jgi:hypothetical protein
MIDRSRSGKQVRASATVRTAYKTIPQGSTGKIAYEIDNGVGQAAHRGDLERDR